MIFLCLVGVLFLLYVYIHFNKQSRQIDKMFPGPFRIPIIGTLPISSFSPKDIAVVGPNLIKAYNYKPFRVWYLNRPYIIIPDSKAAKVVLSQSKFTDKADAYDGLVPWFGRNHFVGRGEQWLRFRKHDVTGFKTSALNSYREIFSKNCDLLVDTFKKMAGDKPVDLYKYIHMYSLDNLVGSLMGYDIKTQAADADSPFIHAIDEMVYVYFWRIVLVILKMPWLFYFTSLYWLQKKAVVVLRQFSKAIVDSKRQPEYIKKYVLNNNNNNNEETEDGEESGPIVDLIGKYVHDPQQRYTDEEIEIEIEMGISAGHGTITSGLSFLFLLLAKHPEHQEKVYEEVMSIFGDSDKTPSLDELAEMKYTEQVIRETLRLYTVVPIIGRHVKEDCYLNDKQFIPGGTDVFIVLSQIHRDPNLWPDPKRFDPSRFSPENVKERDPYAFIPFSAGPRQCLGYRYAFVELKITIAKILREFKLELSDNPADKIQLTMNLLLTSANGFKLKLIPRNKSS